MNRKIVSSALELVNKDDSLAKRIGFIRMNTESTEQNRLIGDKTL